MNQQTRDKIGEAAYKILEIELPEIHPKKWDKLSEEKKEINRRAAEAAVLAYLKEARKEK